MSQSRYLRNPEEIRAIIAQLTSYQTLWLDTEIADWNTPYPRLSLIQVLANPNDKTGESTYILDILDKPEIVPEFVNQIMANEQIEKVFHNASFDLKYLGGKERAKNVTCTYKIAKQISKKVLGTTNLKLKTLAVELCNFPKQDIENEQGSDWGKRPLTQTQFKYAKMDTVYLASVHQHLLNMLQQLKVTDVKLAFECPRLFYLVKHFGGKSLFIPPTKVKGIGETFHQLAEKFINLAQRNPQFQAIFQAEQLETQKVAFQMQDLFYHQIFFPHYLQPAIQNKPHLAQPLNQVWQGLKNLIQQWSELLIKNRIYCTAETLFNRTFVSTELKLQHNFSLPDGRQQPLVGILDCLIYDFQENRFCVVELKTYTPVDPTAQLAQVALYSYMVQQTKKIPVNSAVYCVLPEFKKYQYTWEQLEQSINKLIPAKLQQMQQWLEWQPPQPHAPPPTSNPNLCDICPQQPKCQSYFPTSHTSDNEPKPEAIGRELVETLESFNKPTDYVGAIAGHTFIRIKLKPHKGVQVASILKLAKDLQVQLALPRPPLISPQAGYISVDLPRKNRQIAYFQDYIQPQKKPNDAPVTIAVGVNLEGKLIEADLADPNTCHFLVGGTTGSGKSEFLRSLLLSLIYRHTPAQVKIALVDPKRVTFPEFATMPWLLSPIVKDSEVAIALMQELVTEMERRYRLFEAAGCPHLQSYNQKHSPQPRIVCIFDEYADFMAEKETRTELEANIKRLGGMARAAGIHLIIATQRPEAKIVTPIIRSNLPGRIALLTASEADSKIILGGTSTEAAYLLGKGDLLLQVNAQLQRLQSLYAPKIEFPDQQFGNLS